MIGAAEFEETLFPGLAPVAPALKGHLQGRLHCGGAVVREEHLVQARGRQLRQAPGQEDGRRMGDPQQGAVGQVRQLVGQGLVQFPAPVPVEVGPEGRDPVQVAVALKIIEVNPFPPADNQRGFLPEALHLGEGVPDMLPVPLPESLGVVIHSGPRLRDADRGFWLRPM